MRICAGALLIRGHDILLAKRADDRALTRELLEEIGVRPRAVEEVAVLAEPRPAEHGDARYHVFVARAWDGGEPRLLGTEHSELRWMRVPDALRLPLAHPAYRELFETVTIGAGSNPKLWEA